MGEIPNDIFAEAAGVADMSACASWKEVADLVATALTERRRCAGILLRNFAPNQGESMDADAARALKEIWAR